MEIKVLNGTYEPVHEREWEQLEEIYNICKTIVSPHIRFIYLFLNVEWPQTETDVILFTNKGIATIDAKSWQGTITGNENSPVWRVDGSPMKVNVYAQCNKQRRAVSTKLKDKKGQLGLNHVDDYLLNRIKAWGYFLQDSSYDRSQMHTSRYMWFDVITKHKLTRKVQRLDSGFQLREIHINKFAQIIDLEEINPEVYFGQKIIELREAQQIEKSDIEQDLQELAKGWITKENIVLKYNVQSISTHKEVSYTPLYTKDIIKDKDNRTQDSEKSDIISELNLIERYYTWIIGKPGSGKSSLTKAYFKKAIDKFINQKDLNFPILIEAKNIRSNVSVTEISNDFTDDFRSKINVYEEIGKLDIIIDAIDEAELENHTMITNFLKYHLGKKNNIIITSRWIEGVIFKEIDNYIEQLEKEKKYGHINRLKLEILPMDNDHIKHYILERMAEFSDQDLEDIIEKIEKVQIDKIPLWIDLLTDYWISRPDVTQTSEIKLLAHWIENSRRKKSNLSSVLDDVEQVAFYSYYPKISKIISQSWISSKTKNQVFEILRDIGWVVPSGKHGGEKSYSFVHFRLHEYLAARYLWKNWDLLSKQIFDPYTGLLSQRNKEIVFELAFEDAIRVDGEITDTLIERIIKIAFKVTAEKEVFAFTDLRDPFLAIFLWAIIGKPKNNQISTLIEYLKLFYKYYFPGDKHSDFRNWFDFNKVLRTLYIGDLTDLIIYRDYNYWDTDLRNMKLPYKLQTLFLDSIIKEVADLNQEEDFATLQLVVNHHPNPKKYLKELTNFLELPELNENTRGGIFALTSNVDKKFAASIFFKWLQSKDFDKLKSIKYNFPTLFEFYTYDEFIPNLINTDDLEFRNYVMDRLFSICYHPHRQKEHPDLEKYLSEIIPDEDIPQWFENAKQAIFYNEDEDLWKGGARQRIYDWLIDKYSLPEIFDELQVYRLHFLADDIVSKWHKPISIEDKKKALQFLGNYKVLLNESNFDKLLKSKDDEIDITKSEEYLTYMTINNQEINLEDLFINLEEYNLEDQDTYTYLYSFAQLFSFDTVESNNKLIEIMKKNPRFLNNFWFNGNEEEKKKVKQLNLDRLVLDDTEIFSWYLEYIVEKGDESEGELLTEVFNGNDLALKKLAMFALSYGKFGKLRRSFIPQLMKETDPEIRKSVKRILLSDIFVDPSSNKKRIALKFSQMWEDNQIRPDFKRMRYNNPSIDQSLLTCVLGLQKQFERKLIKLYNIDSTLDMHSMIISNDDSKKFIELYLDHPILKSSVIAKENSKHFIELIEVDNLNEDILYNLICLEDLLFAGSIEFSSVHEYLSNLTNHELSVIKAQAQYLIFAHSDKWIEVVEKLGNEIQVDIQSMWYGISSRKNISKDELEFLMKSIDPNNILVFVAKVLPVSLLHNEILLRMLDNFLQSSDQLIEKHMWKMIDHTFSDIRFQFLLKAVSIYFRIDHHSIIYFNHMAEWIEIFADHYSSKIPDQKLNHQLFKKLSEENLNHLNPHVQLTMADFLIEKNYETYHNLVQSVDNPTMDDLNFMLSHLEKIPLDIQNNTITKSWDLIKEDPQDQKRNGMLILLINRIQSIHGFDGLVVLSDIMAQFDLTLNNSSIWAYFPQIDKKVWEKLEIINDVFDVGMDEFWNWLLNVEKDDQKKIPLYRLQKGKLFELFIKTIEFDGKKEGVKSVYWTLFYLLFDKYYVSNTSIWVEIDKLISNNES